MPIVQPRARTRPLRPYSGRTPVATRRTVPSTAPPAIQVSTATPFHGYDLSTFLRFGVASTATTMPAVPTYTEAPPPPAPPPPPPPEPVPLPPPPPPTLYSFLGTNGAVHNKIHNTIVKYKGEWVWIDTNRGWRNDPDTLHITPLREFEEYFPPYNADYTSRPTPKTRQTVRTDQALLEDFDFEPRQIGYMNNPEHGAIYVEKDGSYGQRYGIYCDVLRSSPGKDGQHLSAWSKPGFVEMLDNIYPTLDEAWAKVTATDVAGVVSVAVSQKLAFCRKSYSLVTLLYKGEQVGEAILRKGATVADTLRLYPAFEHLKSYINATFGIAVPLTDMDR